MIETPETSKSKFFTKENFAFQVSGLPVNKKPIMNPIRFIFYLIYISLFVNHSYSQVPEIPITDYFQLQFSKHSSTWDWKGKFRYSNYSAQNYGFIINDDFNTNLINPKKNIKNWRDENEFDGYFYKSYDSFNTGIYSKSWLLSDQQSGAASGNKNRLSNHALGIKSNYSPVSNFIITPYTGYQRAENQSRIDWGWDVGLDSRLSEFKLENYKGNLRLNIDYDLYRNRQNTAHGVQANFKTQFSQAAKDSLRVNYGYSNKQYFAPNSNDLLHVRIEEKSIHNALDYKLSNSSNLGINTLLSSENILDNSRRIPNRNKFVLENRVNYYFYMTDLILNLGFDSFLENQDNTKIETDSKKLESNMRANLLYSLTPKDNFDLNLFFSKLEYDTPDSLTNHDDRDEIKMVGGLKYRRIFSPALSFEIGAYVKLFHQVYIYRERSANNNWNRIWRLNAAITYKNGNFRNKLTNEILANYTIYDFDEQFSQTQSYIFRKYIIGDSINYAILPGLHFGLNGKFEFEDKGSFFKKEFAQRILQSINFYFFDVFIRLKHILQMDVDTGITYYQRKDWKHVPVKDLIRNLNEISPYGRVKYNLNPELQFAASAAYTVTTDITGDRTTYTTGSLSLIHFF